MRNATPEKARKSKGRLSLSQGKKNKPAGVKTTVDTHINLSPIMTDTFMPSTPRYQPSCADDEVAEPLDDSDNDPTYTPSKEKDTGKDDDEISSNNSSNLSDIDMPKSKPMPKSKHIPSFIKDATPSTSKATKKHVPNFVLQESEKTMKESLNAGNPVKAKERCVPDPQQPSTSTSIRRSPRKSQTPRRHTNDNEDKDDDLIVLSQSPKSILKSPKKEGNDGQGEILYLFAVNYKKVQLKIASHY